MELGSVVRAIDYASGFTGWSMDSSSGCGCYLVVSLSDAPPRTVTLISWSTGRYFLDELIGLGDSPEKLRTRLS